MGTVEKHTDWQIRVKNNKNWSTSGSWCELCSKRLWSCTDWSLEDNTNLAVTHNLSVIAAGHVYIFCCRNNDISVDKYVW